MQNFVNIHFHSKDLGSLMLDHPTHKSGGGMLYFLYNKNVVSVLVCHDIRKGEFVLQVPYFPPIESLEDYKDPKKCMDIVRKSLFSEEVSMLAEVRHTQIDIKNLNTWKMEAVVAESYINKSGDPFGFLVGDLSLIHI